MGAAEKLPEPERPVTFRAHDGPQARFLASSCFEVLYGGEAGGGKSMAIVAMPLRWADNPALYAVTFRRTAPELQPLLALSQRIYKGAFPEARFVANPYPQWRFPSGAIVRYGAMEAELDYESWLGQEIPVLCFDELTTFTRNQYRALIGRVRSSVEGLPRRVRATTNPGGEGHEWVFQRWAPWLDPKCEHSGLPERYDPSGERIPPAASGQVLWVLHDKDGREEYVPPGTRGAETRTFIRARLEDNPTLMQNDPGYEHRLHDNDPVRVAQLRYGNWLIKPGAGLMFKRAWFAEPLEVAPQALARVRYWDRAATEVKVDAASLRLRKKGGTSGPDWTVGTRYSWNGSGKFTVEDVVRLQADPGDVFRTILATAEADGRGTIVCVEQDPAAAGKFEAHAYASALGARGFEVRLYPPTGSKVRRAGPVSAQAKAGNVRVVAGRWLETWLQELEQFPDGPHDDQVDSLSGAHTAITTLPLRRARQEDEWLPPA
jgi:predicted phage terminase large subunit-like protein